MVRRKSSYVLATLLCVSGCVSHSATSTPSPSKQKTEIEYAPETHTYMECFSYDPYPFVGSINNRESEFLIGSGVLVAKNLVITAAHVVENDEDLIYIEHDGDEYCIKEVFYHPDYTGDFFVHDIALVVLESHSDETPIELFNPSTDLLYKRMNLTTVGFGTGEKRFSNYGIFWYYGRLIGNPEFMIMLPMEASIWFGDSGGAVVTPNGKLIGIMSYFASTRKGKIFENGCASIEYYRDWLLKMIKERMLM